MHNTKLEIDHTGIEFTAISSTIIVESYPNRWNLIVTRLHVPTLFMCTLYVSLWIKSSKYMSKCQIYAKIATITLHELKIPHFLNEHSTNSLIDS